MATSKEFSFRLAGVPDAIHYCNFAEATSNGIEIGLSFGLVPVRAFEGDVSGPINLPIKLQVLLPLAIAQALKESLETQIAHAATATGPRMSQPEIH